MNQSVYIRGSVTPAEAGRLTLAVERGLRSRNWLVGQIVRQWLGDPRRTLPVQAKPDAMGLTLQQRQCARRREQLLKRWTAARVAGRRRGQNVRQITEQLMATLADDQRVSLGTLYNWALRYQGYGVAGLVDGRNATRVQGRQTPAIERASKAV